MAKVGHLRSAGSGKAPSNWRHACQMTSHNTHSMTAMLEDHWQVRSALLTGYLQTQQAQMVKLFCPLYNRCSHVARCRLAVSRQGRPCKGVCKAKALSRRLKVIQSQPAPRPIHDYIMVRMTCRSGVWLCGQEQQMRQLTGSHISPWSMQSLQVSLLQQLLCRARLS